jgi:copper chaperone CopZ
MPLIHLLAPAIECDGCARSISRALGKLSGVGRVEVDVSSKVVTVDYGAERVKVADIAARLEQIGFPSAPADGGP